MLPVIIIAFREFLEAFLIIGVFLGVSRKLQLNKERPIKIASGLALLVTLIIAPYFFWFTTHSVSSTFSDITEAVLALASAIFIPLTVFSLHSLTGKFTHDKIKQIKAQATADVDWSTWLPIVVFLLVLKEGAEAAFFNLSSSFFNTFTANIEGFTIGFVLAGVCGAIINKLYVRLPIKKLYKITEVFVVLIGIHSLQDGLTIVGDKLHFSFDNYILLIQLIYVVLVYAIFIREPDISTN